MLHTGYSGFSCGFNHLARSDHTVRGLHEKAGKPAEVELCGDRYRRREMKEPEAFRVTN
jgi:hypothetical protein